MTEANTTQELLAHLRRKVGGVFKVCIATTEEQVAADLIEAQAAEIAQMKDSASKAEAALAAMTAECDAAVAHRQQLLDALATRDASIHALIVEKLSQHRLWYMTGDDELGYPLVDALTPDGCTIEKGTYEIEQIADLIADEVMRFVYERDAAVGQVKALREALEEARRQIFYLHMKFPRTGSSEAVLALIDATLAASAPQPKEEAHG